MLCLLLMMPQRFFFFFDTLNDFIKYEVFYGPVIHNGLFHYFFVCNFVDQVALNFCKLLRQCVFFLDNTSKLIALCVLLAAGRQPIFHGLTFLL